MYAPIRLYLQTTSGGFFVAAASSLNQLPRLLANWFVNTPNGRSVDDDIVQYAIIMVLNVQNGSYSRESMVQGNSRVDLIKNLEQYARTTG